MKTYIQGIQNDILHHHMTTTPHTMSFQTREKVFIENFHLKISPHLHQKLGKPSTYPLVIIVIIN